MSRLPMEKFTVHFFFGIFGDAAVEALNERDLNENKSTEGANVRTHLCREKKNTIGVYIGAIA